MMDIEHTISYQMRSNALFQGFDDNNFQGNKSDIATGFSPWKSLTFLIRFGAIFVNCDIHVIRGVLPIAPDIYRNRKNGDKTIHP